jgi:hypothetical protein
VRRALSILLLAVLASGCGSSGEKSASDLAPVEGRHYSPTVDAKNFVREVDNRFFPLKPGTAYHFEGVRGKTAQTDDLVVTNQTERILGIDATVVRDTVSEHGHPIERTHDFYAQDKQGNVWYMGEDSFELQQGRFVKASDSWRSGENGAKPGIIMPAEPEHGDRYRQEYYPPGEALDEATVLGQRGPFTVPYGTFEHALVTSDYSPLEPQTEEKVYVAGIGEIKESVVKGHHEEFRLVSVTHS